MLHVDFCISFFNTHTPILLTKFMIKFNKAQREVKIYYFYINGLMVIIN